MVGRTGLTDKQQAALYFARKRRRDARLSVPQIQISNLRISEEAGLTDVLGVLSTYPKPDDWGDDSYSIIEDDDDKIDLDDATVIIDGILDYESASSHRFRVRNTPTGPYEPIERKFEMRVLNSSYDVEAEALVAAMSVAPSESRKQLIVETISALKTAGIWNKLDLLYVTAAHDSQAGLLNWIAPGSYTATIHGTVAFHVDEGFEGDDDAGSYLDCNWAPSTHATKIGQNSGHMALWSLTSGQTDYIIGHTQIGIAPRSATNNFSTRALSGTTHNTGSITDGSGMFAWARRNSADIDKYINGVEVTSAASNTSAAFTGGNMRMLGSIIGGGGAGIVRQAMMSVGGELSDAEMATYHSIMSAYMSAVGAI